LLILVIGEQSIIDDFGKKNFLFVGLGSESFLFPVIIFSRKRWGEQVKG